MNDDCMKHGAFGWFELLTPNPDEASSFYTKLFGWETEDCPMEGVEYTVLKVNGEQVGGIMKTPADCQGMPPCWGIYITVDNVDSVAEQVGPLGGQLLRPPMDIPEVGRFCVIQDPQGATICAITYVKK